MKKVEPEEVKGYEERVLEPLVEIYGEGDEGRVGPDSLFSEGTIIWIHRSKLVKRKP